MIVVLYEGKVLSWMGDIVCDSLRNTRGRQIDTLRLVTERGRGHLRNF